MITVKNKYFLIIENIKDIDLKNIKIRNKFHIIYRKKNYTESITKLLNFRRVCKNKSIKFFIANNVKLAVLLKSDGIYLSGFNNSLRPLFLKKSNFKLIGSAHNLKEITIKIKQQCSSILFSKLFVVNYDKKASTKGIIRFNNFLKLNENLIPLGGITQKNLNSLNMVNSKGFAVLSAIKKKPAKIFNRLF